MLSSIWGIGEPAKWCVFLCEETATTGFGIEKMDHFNNFVAPDRDVDGGLFGVLIVAFARRNG